MKSMTSIEARNDLCIETVELIDRFPCDLELNTPFGVLRAKGVRVSVLGEAITLESSAVFKHDVHTVVLAAQSGLEIDLTLLTTDSIERIAEQKAAIAAAKEKAR